MKNSEIHSLTVEELQEKITTEVVAYDKLKFSHAISPIENPMQIRKSRKLIARLKTALNAKQVNA